MGLLFTPLAAWKMGCEFWRVVAEAQTVMVVRMMGLDGIYSKDPSENARLIVEKNIAFAGSAPRALETMRRRRRADRISRAPPPPQAVPGAGAEATEQGPAAG